MSNKKFLLIPNHPVVVSDNSIRAETAEVDLLQVVRGQFPTIGIAAFVTQRSISSLGGALRKSDIALHRLNDYEHPRTLLIKSVSYVRAALTLPLVLVRYDFLYIFCPGYCGLLAAFWARLLRKPYGLYVRGTWLDSKSKTALWWRWVFRGTQFMIVTGEAFRRRLLPYCDEVSNEVPLTALKPRDVDINESFDRPVNRILFAGRLNESKGVRDVVRAVAALRNEGFAIELSVAGGGTDAEILALNDLRDELDIRHAVSLLGHVSPAVLAENYRRNGVFVFPSYYAEGFPRVLYEAMMYGAAIVTCEMPGTEGFLVDGVNCLYCKPADPEHLAACVRRLLCDPDLAGRLGRTARADVERVYDAFIDESHAQQLLRLVGNR